MATMAADKGRPAKPEDERAAARVSVAMTRSEKRLLQEAADAEGSTLSRFMLTTALRRAKNVVKKID